MAFTGGALHIEHGSGGAYAFVFALAVVFAAGDTVRESQLPAIIQSPSFLPVECDRDAANFILRMLQSLGFCAQLSVGIALPCEDDARACSSQAEILLGLMVLVRPLCAPH